MRPIPGLLRLAGALQRLADLLLWLAAAQGPHSGPAAPAVTVRVLTAEQEAAMAPTVERHVGFILLTAQWIAEQVAFAALSAIDRADLVEADEADVLRWLAVWRAERIAAGTWSGAATAAAWATLRRHRALHDGDAS